MTSKSLSSSRLIATYTPAKGHFFGVDTLIRASFLLSVLYLPARWFAALEQRRPDPAWRQSL